MAGSPFGRAAQRRLVLQRPYLQRALASKPPPDSQLCQESWCAGAAEAKATSKGIAPPNSSSRSNSRLGPEQAVCDQVRPEAMALLSDKFCLLSDYDEEIYSASVCSDGEWVMEGEEGCTGEVWREGERELVMHGRLAKCIPFWKEMGASEWVVSILKGGYRLPFVSDHRGGGVKKNQGGCNSHGSFVDEAVKSLVQCGSAMEGDRRMN